MRYLGRKLHADDLATQSDVGSGGGAEAWRIVGTPGQPSWQNGWGNYGSGYVSTAFALDGGVLHIRGLITGGTPDAPAFFLPVGYRPSGTRGISSVHSAGAGWVRVRTDGAVVPVLAGAVSWFSLEISFRVT